MPSAHNWIWGKVIGLFQFYKSLHCIFSRKPCWRASNAFLSLLSFVTQLTPSCTSRLHLFMGHWKMVSGVVIWSSCTAVQENHKKKSNQFHCTLHCWLERETITSKVAFAMHTEPKVNKEALVTSALEKVSVCYGRPSWRLVHVVSTGMQSGAICIKTSYTYQMPIDCFNKSC